MKICILGRANYTIVQRRARAFIDRGHEVYIISLQHEYIDGCKVYTYHPSKLIQQSRSRYLMAIPYIYRTVQQISPDVIDMHGVSSYGLFALLPFKQPLVLTVYGPDLYSDAAHSQLLYHVVKSALKRATLVIGSTATVRDYVQQNLHLELNQRLQTRRGGIPVSDISSNALARRIEIRKELGTGEQTRVILHSRHMNELWRIPILIEAMPQVLSQYPDSELWLAYPTPNENGVKLLKFIEKRVDALGITHKVRFLGQNPYQRMISIMHAADVYVCIGTADLLASSIQEALCTGLIPVLSNLPSYQEVIQTGKNGFFIDEVTPENLAVQLINILMDFTNLQPPIASYNQALIKADFNLDDGIEWLLNQYKHAIELKGHNEEQVKLSY